MTLPIYTAALGAFVLILQVVLMLRVGLYRGANNKFLGIGDDKELERKVRRHGNLAENSGLFIAVIALFELLVGQTTWVLSVCIVFAVARVLHAIGFTSLAGSHGENLTGSRKAFAAARAVGALGTLVTALGTAAGIAFTLNTGA